MQRILGAGLVTIGVVVNNYAFLHGASTSSPAGGVVVVDSARMAIAGGGVVLISIGLLILLRWARSISHPPQHG